MLPSFAGQPGANFRNVRAGNDEVWMADVFDDQGYQSTAAAVELEQRRLLDPAEQWRGRASVVALGIAVSLHADDAAFSAVREFIATECESAGAHGLLNR